MIPREMLSGALPATPRLTLQLPPEALDSTRNYLATSLGTIWRACPVLFAHPVTPASDRMVVLVRPSEGIVSPFRIAGGRPPGASHPREGAVASVIAGQAAASAPVRSGELPPFLQEPTHFGVPMQVVPAVAPVPAYSPVEQAMGAPAHALGMTGGSEPVALIPAVQVPQMALPVPEPELIPSVGASQVQGPAYEDPNGPEGGSAFLAALRQGIAPAEVSPAEPNPATRMEAKESANTVTFSLGELFGHFTRETLPFDLSTVSPKWKVHFPSEFITRQLPSGRVVATFAKIFECADPEAKSTLGALAGSAAEVAIPLRAVFERLPVHQKRQTAEEEPRQAGPEIFSESGGAAPLGEAEVFPGRFEPQRMVLEPMAPVREDLSDAPEYASHDIPPAEEPVASLDDLEDAQPAQTQGSLLPVSPAGRGAGQAGELDGLPSVQVPDFSGLGFSPEPVADLELRAMFASHEAFTPQKAVDHTAGLPGIDGVVLFRRKGEIVASRLPADGMANRLAQQTPLMFQRIQDLAAEWGFAGTEVFTLHTSRGIVSFFGQSECCLAVMHRGGVFGPGMREKLMLIARGMASLLR